MEPLRRGERSHQRYKSDSFPWLPEISVHRVVLRQSVDLQVTEYNTERSSREQQRRSIRGKMIPIQVGLFARVLQGNALLLDGWIAIEFARHLESSGKQEGVDWRAK